MTTPDLGRTQAYVDPLVGSKFGAYTIVARAGAGRFGTLYRAEDERHSAVTLQVLRTELVGNEHEVSAANALKCAGVARVSSSGVLPDGRHVRVMELLDGRSLDDELHLNGRFSPTQVIEVLGALLEILSTTHAWQVVHGRLGASSVLRVAGQLRLIDFGLATSPVTPADDLKAAGALGLALLSGKEFDGAAPPRRTETPERLHQLLLGLFEGRVDSAAAARRELDWLKPSATARKPRRFVALGLLALALAGAGAWLKLRAVDAAPPPTEPVAPAPAPELDAGASPLDAGEAPDAGVEAPPSEPAPVKEPPRKKVRADKPPPKSPAPTVAALKTQLRASEVKLLQRKLNAADKEEARHVLNKLRLRLTGDVTEEDRRDIAARLAAWKHIWLK